MRDDLRHLYQETILEHGKHPRNFKVLQPCTHSQEAFNPVCGDQLTLYLNVEDDKIQEAAFIGKGCAISMASASLMTQAVKGKSVAQAHALFEQFRRLVTGEAQKDEGQDEAVSVKLQVLAGVKEFPGRVKCATLSWHALEHALDKNGTQPVTTE